jgi:hypothetical protein
MIGSRCCLLPRQLYSFAEGLGGRGEAYSEGGVFPPETEERETGGVGSVVGGEEKGEGLDGGELRGSGLG